MIDVDRVAYDINLLEVYGMRIESVKRMVKFSFALMIACSSLLLPVDMKKAHASDPFDLLREKYVDMLTSPSTYSLTDVDNAARVDQITDAAQEHWDTMITDVNRSKLWNEYPISAANYPSSTTYSYRFLVDMALAYRTYGSPLMGDTGLKAAIIDGLDWLHGRIYYSGATTGGSNWWYWQVGNPLALNDLVALMYDDLTQTQIDENMAAVNYFQNNISMSGANRMWEIQVCTIAAILAKNNVPVGISIADARDGMSEFLPYVSKGDGFYIDGSFIQHTSLAYTGGYGTSLLSSLAKIMYLLDGSTWEVTDTNFENVYQWIYDSFEPLVYKGNLMDTVRGREISRYKVQDNVASGEIYSALIQLSYLASGTDAAAFRSMVKSWLQADPSKNYYKGASMWLLTEAKSILNDTDILPRTELVKYQQFASMDRVVQLRPGYGFNVGMSSDRIMNYESINSENRNIWHVGDGMTTLYNNDVTQFNDNFWPTVDNYRLPGTTVLSGVVQESEKGKSAWAGGTDMLGLYGVTGMEYHALGESNTVPDKTLTAKKSWFMFDDEIVALGSDINSTDGVSTETIVENRKINLAGDNALTVNGTAKSTSLGWAETMSGTNYIHLGGNVSGSDIGYYFPGGSTIKGLREARTGEWYDINTNKGSTTQIDYTHNYMTLWFDHGVNPTNGTYSYVLLPNKTSTQVASYATSPNITILENSSEAQAVKETGLNMTGINFWQDARKTVSGVTSDSKSSVMTRETANDFEVSVSDPTQDNVGNIYIEVANSAKNLISKDDAVTILQYSPTIKFKVNVKASAGKAFKVKFGLTGTQAANPSPIPLPIPYEAETQPVHLMTDSIVVYNDTNASGGKKLGFNHSAAADYTEFSLDVTQAGTYNVLGRIMKASNNSIIQLSINGVNVGPTIDGYWNTSETFKDALFGTYTFIYPGSYLFRVTTTGKNASASGYRLMMDYFTLTPLPADGSITVDNTDYGFFTDSAWTTKTTTPNYYGPNYREDGTSGADATKWAKWVPTIPVSGNYDIYMRWPSDTNRPDAAPLEITYNGGIDTSKTVNQQVSGGEWMIIGNYPLTAGISNEVKLLATDAGYTNADAVKFVPTFANNIERTSGGIATASDDNAPNETVDKAFDDSSNTKWLAKATTGWLQYQFASSNAYAVKKYTLTSANDYSTRDPKNWTLYGSHDGINWTPLDVQSNQTFATRKLKQEYTITNNTAYEYYKLDINLNNGHPYTQLAELELID
jgi:hyaluronate lyase